MKHEESIKKEDASTQRLTRLLGSHVKKSRGSNKGTPDKHQSLFNSSSEYNRKSFSPAKPKEELQATVTHQGQILENNILVKHISNINRDIDELTQMLFEKHQKEKYFKALAEATFGHAENLKLAKVKSFPILILTV